MPLIIRLLADMKKVPVLILISAGTYEDKYRDL